MTYEAEQKLLLNDKIELLKQKLPKCMRSYINDISQVTSERTRVAYIRELIKFLEYLIEKNPLCKNMQTHEIPFEYIQQLTKDDILEYLSYLDGRSLSIDARLRSISALSGYFDFEVDNKNMDINPCARIKRPKKKKSEHQITRLSKEEVKTMNYGIEISNSGSERSTAYTIKSQLRDTAIFTVFVETGLRVSELVGLDLVNVDLEKNTLYVRRKGDKTMNVFFPEATRKALSDYIQYERPYYTASPDEPALFLSNRKKRISVRSVETMLEKYGKANLNLSTGTVHPHLLRRTFGTTLYNETGDIKLVADILGHENVETTSKHYAAIDEEHRAKNQKMNLYKFVKEENEQDAE